jgi:hypothetical protein
MPLQLFAARGIAVNKMATPVQEAQYFPLV